MLTMVELREIFGWMTLINLGVLSVWFFLIMFAHDWIYRLHCKWFDLSRENFDAIHYAGMALFKIGIILLAHEANCVTPHKILKNSICMILML